MPASRRNSDETLCSKRIAGDIAADSLIVELRSVKLLQIGDSLIEVGDGGPNIGVGALVRIVAGFWCKADRPPGPGCPAW